MENRCRYESYGLSGEADIDYTYKIWRIRLFQTKMNAQRIDTRYQIDETGHIKKIKELEYQPQDYMILDFTGNSRNIWDGKEQPLVP